VKLWFGMKCMKEQKDCHQQCVMAFYSRVANIAQQSEQEGGERKCFHFAISI
jgi:hypothetical protein